MALLNGARFDSEGAPIYRGPYSRHGLQFVPLIWNGKALLRYFLAVFRCPLKLTVLNQTANLFV